MQRLLVSNRHPAGTSPTEMDAKRFLRDTPLSRRHHLQHGEDFFFQLFDVRFDFLQRARGLVLVEVAVEGDFVADLDLAVVDPGVGAVGQDFGGQIRFAMILHQSQQSARVDLALVLLSFVVQRKRQRDSFRKRNVLRVAQIRIGLPVALGVGADLRRRVMTRRYCGGR